jgi:hypothetical protein
MELTERDQKICDKYSQRDINGDGKVMCYKCPLRVGKGSYDFRCKANSRYNKHTHEWEREY